METVRYFNGKIYAGGGRFINEFFVKGGYFSKPDRPQREVDLQGSCVVPGFIDSHTHIVPSGLNSLGLDVSGCGTMEELLSSIRSYVERGKENLLFARGFDETMLKEKRFPTMEEFVSATGDIPFHMVRVDLHSMMANKAFEDKYGFKGSDGIIRGEDYDRAVITVGNSAGESSRLAGMKNMERMAAAAGVTYVHTMEGWVRDFTNVDFLLKHQEELTLDTLVYPQVWDMEGVVSRGFPRIGGCLLIDGSLGSRTAALKQPYSDAAENRGRLYHTLDELTAFMGPAHEQGLQLSFHAIGDSAVEQITQAYHEIFSRYGRGAQRHRVEHCLMADRSMLESLASMGLWLDFQPAFHKRWAAPGGLYEKRVGRKRVSVINPIGTAQELGIPFAFGSDCDVTPLDPLGGIYAAVEKDRRGEDIDIYTAVDAFTIKAAEIGNIEDHAGSIDPGKLGDFVVLDNDIFSGSGRASVSATYKRGSLWTP